MDCVHDLYYPPFFCGVLPVKVSKIAAFALGPIGSASLSLITVPLIAWFYTPEDIGRIAMLNVLISFSALLFGFGLDQAFVREYHEADNKAKLLKTCLLPGFFLVTIVLTSCLLVPGLLSRLLFSLDSQLVSLMLALCVLTAFITIFLSNLIRMQEKWFLLSLSQILPKAMYISIVGIYVIFKFGINLLHLVAAQTIALAGTTLFLAWITREQLMQSIQAQINYVKLRTLIKFGAPLILSGVFFWGLTSLDKIFLRSMSSYEELALYSVSVSFAGVALIFQGIFSTVWAPLVYKWTAERVEPEKIHQVTDHVLAFAILLFALMGVFSWLVTFFVPATYYNAQYLLPLCMCYPLFYTLSETTVVGIGITRKTAYSMLASMIALVANALGNYLLVPKIGATGAAIATATAFWFFLFCRTKFSDRVWHKTPRHNLYYLTLISLFISISFSVYGSSHKTAFTLLWALLFIYSLFTFRNILTPISKIICQRTVKICNIKRTLLMTKSTLRP